MPSNAVMSRLKLPIGIANFQTIRTRGYYYVDKTPHIERLINQGECFFLSRPRRFGKSLLLDTMLELFKGNESLFQDLYIHDRWDWSITYPVVRLSFGSGYSVDGNLESYVYNELTAIARSFHVPHEIYSNQGQEFLKNILRHIHETTSKQAVVLVDEYDKPILDAIGNLKLAESNRNYLQGFYGTIKDSQQHIRFAFLTGITMFSKMNLFSSLNNLINISLDPRYAAICGYTEIELEAVFASEMEGINRDEIRRWYNGYDWRGDDKVYNPWNILNLLDTREFEAYWFNSGVPTFLYKIMRGRQFTPLDIGNLKVEKSFVSRFDVDDISAEALMFQAGYLTITGEQHDGFETVYDLDYPNYEVQASFVRGYLNSLFGPGRKVPAESKQLAGLLKERNFDGFGAALRALLSSIPYEWHKKNDMAYHEGWYCSVLHACLWDVADTTVHSEHSHNRGRSDLTLTLDDQVFVFECKIHSGNSGANEKASEAIRQIREKGYADQYRDGVRTIHLIGAVFCAEQRNLATMIVERG